MEVGKAVICPHDGHIAYKIYYVDDVERWFCPHCRRVLNDVEYECRCGYLVGRNMVDEKKAEQQRHFVREVGSAEIELVGLVRGDNADLWRENKRLKDIAATGHCSDFCPAEEDVKCTGECAEKSWMDYWMGGVGYHEKRPD